MSRLFGYLPGPPVSGLWGIFERDFGDDETPLPYDRVVPSRDRAGDVLPFKCPRCRETIDFSRGRGEHYRDRRRGWDASTGRKVERDNHFCPLCGWRFHLDERGPVTSAPIYTTAPSTVIGGDGRVRRDRAGFFEQLTGSMLQGVHVVGAMAARRVAQSPGQRVPSRAPNVIFPSAQVTTKPAVRKPSGPAPGALAAATRAEASANRAAKSAARALALAGRMKDPKKQAALKAASARAAAAASKARVAGRKVQATRVAGDASEGLRVVNRQAQQRVWERTDSGQAIIAAVLAAAAQAANEADQAATDTDALVQKLQQDVADLQAQVQDMQQQGGGGGGGAPPPPPDPGSTSPPDVPLDFGDYEPPPPGDGALTDEDVFAADAPINDLEDVATEVPTPFDFAFT